MCDIFLYSLETPLNEKEYKLFNDKFLIPLRSTKRPISMDDCVIAGGFASHLCGLTSTYSDVDVFIRCKTTLHKPISLTTNYPFRFNRDYDRETNIDFVYCGLDNKHMSTKQFAYFLLSKHFDMDICKTGIYFSAKYQYWCKIILSANLEKHIEQQQIPSQDRMEKYKNRSRKYAVPSLNSLAYREILFAVYCDKNFE